MKNHKLATKRSNSRMLLCATAVAALATAQGCASDTADDGVDGNAAAGPDDTLALQTTSGESTLRDPNGTYFANVTANGTGCPAGSWETSISEDGKTFTTTFSKYEALVDEKTLASVKDCYLSIKLNSPAGLSYAVTDFHYTGYAFLEEGVKGRQTASYYFQGDPVGQKENRTELVGPRDDTYLFSDEVKTVDQVWSPCGKERDLLVVTRVRVENSTPRRTGYVNLSALDATTRGKVILKLGVKKCDGTPVGGGSTATPGGSTATPGGSTATPGGSTATPGTPSNPGTRPANPGTNPLPGTPAPGSTTSTGGRTVREGGRTVVSGGGPTILTPGTTVRSGGGPAIVPSR